MQLKSNRGENRGVRVDGILKDFEGKERFLRVRATLGELSISVDTRATYYSR